MRFEDMAGKTFGRLTVIKRAPDLRKGIPRWECQCSCGNITFTSSADLKRGSSKSCGCLHKETYTIDLVGRTFGRLTVVKRSGTDRYGKAQWECQCACGNIKTVNGNNLRSGGTTSCGCRSKEQMKNLKLTHGKHYTSEYSIWAGIVKRCTNSKCKNFKNYGGRGITMYPGWMASFQDFYDYVGPRPSVEHSIERIDNNLGYIPGNIKWATKAEQNNNRRSNHNITFNGKTMNLKQWAKELGIKRTTLNSRIVLMGWPIEKAFAVPVRQSHIAPSAKLSSP